MSRVRGNKGELAGVSFTDQPERFEKLSRVLVGDTPYEIESVWYHKGQPIFKFKGVDSIDAAEPLAGLELRIPESERLPLPEGEFYLSDLVGCALVDDTSGRHLGRVTAWQETGGPVLLEVDNGRFSVPFVASFLKKIDPAGGEIRVALPEGLEEINGPGEPGPQSSGD